MANNNFHLTYGDLKKFTNEELKQFRYCHLMLDKLRLVDEIQKQNIIVPDEIRDKVFDLCDTVGIPYSKDTKITLEYIVDLVYKILNIGNIVIDKLPLIKEVLLAIINYIK